MPPPTAMLMAHELVARGQAWARAAGGEFSAARAELLATAEGAAQLGKVSIALTLLHDVVRLGEASPAVVEQLASLAGRVDGDAVLPAAKAAHAAGLAAADAATVESAAARFDQCGARLLAAEAYADAARLYRASSLVAASAAAARRAGELAASCPGAKTPGLVDLADPGAGVATAIPLTAREREIAALAARGLSSKDIAARLSVAVRTVDNHLQRVYLKLGVSGRDSLGEVLSEQ